LRGENIFSPLWYSKAKSQFRPACKKSEKISKNEVRRPPPFYGNVDIPL